MVEKEYRVTIEKIIIAEEDWQALERFIDWFMSSHRSMQITLDNWNIRVTDVEKEKEEKEKEKVSKSK